MHQGLRVESNIDVVVGISNDASRIGNYYQNCHRGIMSCWCVGSTGAALARLACVVDYGVFLLCEISLIVTKCVYKVVYLIQMVFIFSIKGCVS